jgi:sortase (surface protein transpeptidase)
MSGVDWRVIRHRSGARRLLIGLAAVLVAGLLTAGAVTVRDRSNGGDGRVGAAAGSATASSAPPVGPLTVETVQASEAAQLPPPSRVRIPAIGVDSALESLTVDQAGVLQGPVDYGRAGWYAGGVAPGDQGPAVIAGHVDSARGPAVFYRLRDLKAGDEIAVARGATWVTFRVVTNERYPKDQFPTDQVYRPTPVPELRLITCGGTFDRSRRSYTDNIVVYAIAT